MNHTVKEQRQEGELASSGLPLSVQSQRTPGALLADQVTISQRQILENHISVHTNLGNGHANSRKLETTEFCYMQ